MRRFGLLPWLAGVALTAPGGTLSAQVGVASPDGRNHVTVEVREGRLSYGLARDGRPLILTSLLGFTFGGAPPHPARGRLSDTTPQAHHDCWTQTGGEVCV
jgi:alpha-glucosidase